MLQAFTTVEEAKVGLLAYLKELAIHPAINADPDRISIDVSSRYRRRHACCRWKNGPDRKKSWTIIFNLHVLKANLDNTAELEHICQHEMAHVPQPNHGPKFRQVCRALGMPEDRIGAKTSKLKSAAYEEIWVCLRCGTKAKTLRSHTNKLKRCSWCGMHWDQGLGKLDKSKTMAMFPIKDAGSVGEMGVQGKDRHLQTRWLPWKEYAQYLRDGGQFTVMHWWTECLRQGIYEIPAKYQGKGLAPEFTQQGLATAVKSKE